MGFGAASPAEAAAKLQKLRLEAAEKAAAPEAAAPVVDAALARQILKAPSLQAAQQAARKSLGEEDAPALAGEQHRPRWTDVMQILSTAVSGAADAVLDWDLARDRRVYALRRSTR